MSEEPKQESRSLRERLRALLTGEFQGLDPQHVATVLSGMASELIQMSEAGIQRISEIDSEAGAWKEHLQAAGDSAFPMKSVRRRDVYEIEAVDVDRVESLLEQMLGLGALVFAIEDPPALNEVVDIAVTIPTFHIAIETSGRVVHHSPNGTAIEVSNLSKEDRVALESIRSDLLAGDVSEVSEVSRPSIDAERSPDESSSPWDSGVPMPNISRRPDRSFRRQISLTQPDAAVLTSTKTSAPGSETKELYGPEPIWYEPSGEPDRVERVAADRIIDILLQASESRLTGMLYVDVGAQGKMQILLEDGLVCDVAQEPRAAAEELGLMLYNADRISKQQLAMASAHADESREDIARSLLELGILEPEQIRKSIASRLTYLLQRVTEFTSGEVEIYGGSSLPAGFLPNPPLRVHIAIERIVFRGLYEDLRARPMKERENFQADALDAYPEIVFEERDRVMRALTDEAHVELMDNLLRGRRRLQEVFTESGLSHAETFGLVHALHRMGLVRFDRSLHQTIVRERYRENVTVKYLSVHKASYFEVLNVHWSSYSKMVQAAYEELIEQFDPDDVPENLEDEVAERVTEIRDRIESAYQVLAERETRHAYRKRIMPEYKLAHAIPLFLKQAELAERRRQWGDASDALLRVLEIEPDHAQAKGRLSRVEAIIDKRLSPDAIDSNF